MAKVRYRFDELPEISAEDIRRMASIKDENIDTGDMPELTEEFWENAERGRFYCEKERIMKIDLEIKDILKYARRFDIQKYNDSKIYCMLPQAVKRGYMEKDCLHEVAKFKWKGGRTKDLCAENTEELLKKISAIVFNDKNKFEEKNDILRMATLRLLNGVEWPMASTILHFAFPNQYPILDKNTMQAIGSSCKPPKYNIELWLDYIKICRDKRDEMDKCDEVHRHISKSCNIMRLLDKALFVQGQENSKKKALRRRV